MPLMNYRTKVAPAETISEIMALLARKGAQSVTTHYAEDGEPAGVAFTMKVGKMPVNFQLPVNVEGVSRALAKESKAVARTAKERAKWVAWRILKDWTAAQIALVESNQAEAVQVFMPYALQDSGEPLYKGFVEHQLKLGAGK